MFKRFVVYRIVLSVSQTKHNISRSHGDSSIQALRILLLVWCVVVVFLHSNRRSDLAVAVYFSKSSADISAKSVLMQCGEGNK